MDFMSGDVGAGSKPSHVLAQILVCYMTINFNLWSSLYKFMKKLNFSSMPDTSARNLIKVTSLAIIGLFLLIYIAPLGISPLAIPDETRYSEIPREMIASGDWVAPHIDGLRYFEKPAMGYWLNAISIMTFGENRFAARFPSAMATGLSALMLFFFARRFSRDALTGIFTASIFLLFIEVFGVASSSVLDAPFSFFVTASVIFYFFAVTEQVQSRRRLFLVLSGVFCGFSFLTKGFLAFALLLIIIVPYMIWERRFKDILKSLWIPALVAVLVSLPWCIMIHLREPDFWNFFFWNEHIRRFTSRTAQHDEPFWYFLRLLPFAALPWTFLAPAAWLGLRNGAFSNSMIKYSLCWFLFPFIFFSISSGKLLTYILPCFPPLAVLFASGIKGYLITEGKKTYNMGALLLAILICMFAIALPVFQIFGYHGIKPYTDMITPAVLTAALFFWALYAFFSTRVVTPGKKFFLFAAAPALFMFVIHFGMPEMIIERKMPGDFLLAQSGKVNPNSIIVADDSMITSACWFYKRADIYLMGKYGEFSYGLGYKDSMHRHLDLVEFRDFVTQNRGKGLVTIIAKSKSYQGWKIELPQPVFETSNGKDGFVFAQF
jgi:4-amino-4-deoxy-L-arabinose transferase